ncbi:hypothetical protein BJX65DRAFT_68937 [Aspergillus insuetus]
MTSRFIVWLPTSNVDIINAEIADQWAHPYPCPISNNEVFTRGTSGWSSNVCEQDLGNYTWVSGNVMVAQLGVSSSSTTSSSAPSTSATSSEDSSAPSPLPTESSMPTSTASCAALSAGNDTTMKTELGVGLGLGVPLLLALACLAWFYLHTQQKIQSLQ